MMRQRETPEGVAALFTRIQRAENSGCPPGAIQAMRKEHAERRKRLHQQEISAAQAYHVQYEARKDRSEANIRGTA